MDQVTATIEPRFEDGREYLAISFLAVCGCRWTVDMWGNVRSVAVCQKCTTVPYAVEHQLNLQLVAAG